ncbi:DNA binding protein [Pseudomonas sp. LFM046]|uniref:DNA binding protein n=1 Tax=Pseudomonas sp. LFM046 TaxID=1608357 RepID=UPI0005CFEF87|nr:DNA binding protein [Pseudomonas sp. LFM046]
MPALTETDRHFISAVHALMREYNVSRSQLLAMLDRNTRRAVPGPTPQPLKTYLNPHTQQSIQVRACRNLTYRAWVAEYGDATVATWQIEPGRIRKKKSERSTR